MTKYYKTRAVTLDFVYKRTEKTIVEVTISALDEPAIKFPDSATFTQPIIVDLCIDTHLLKGMVDRFKNLNWSQTEHYIDRFQTPACAQITRNFSSDILEEKANLEPIFAALGVDEFEIIASNTEIVRALCNEIRYGFNGSAFYLQAPDRISFSPYFQLHFFEISQAEYWQLL